MLNRVNGRRELDRVNMFIRVISDEMAQTKAGDRRSEVRDEVAIEMEEALYELRLRKLLISALVDSDRDNSTTSH